MWLRHWRIVGSRSWNAGWGRSSRGCGARRSATGRRSRFGWQKRAGIPANTFCGELKSSASPLEQLSPVLAELAGWPDMPVKGLAGDAELAA